MKNYLLDSRFIINSAILILALFVCIFCLHFIWDSYQIHRTTQYIQHANRVIDWSTDAAGIQAIERGMTSAALGMNAEVNKEFRQRIEQLRKQGDSLWLLTQQQAAVLGAGIPESGNFETALQEARRAFIKLKAVRARIDAFINYQDAEPVKLDEWVETVTQFIHAESRLREHTFSITPLPNEIRDISQVIKQRVWLISEHAGLERAHIAYYIAKNETIPDEVIRELIELRGVVEHSFADLEFTLRYRQNIDTRIIDAVKLMKQKFFMDFNESRISIYAASKTGLYPYTAEEWVDKATSAIDSILAVGKVVSRISEEHANSISNTALYQLIIILGMVIFALILAGWGLLHVRQTINNLFHQKELAEVTLHSIGDAVITTDADARIEYLNPIAEELTGWSNKDAAGRSLKEIFVIINGFTMKPQANPVEECLREGHIVGLGNNVILTTRDKREIMIEDSAAPIRDHDGNIVGAVMVFYDVTEMRNAPHLLSYHATHDALTGLYNRREFERRLAELLMHSKSMNSQHALCYIDLDQFKVINDTSGHVIGDKLLQQLTYLIKEHIREADMLARLGGDEFGLLLQNCNIDKALDIAESLRKIIKDFRFVWNTSTFELGASIGLVPINANSVSPAEVLSEADAACYAAKEKGRNRVQVYKTNDQELARRHGEMHWVSRINDAIKNDRLTLYVQPIMSLSDANTRYFEILLRLIDEQGHIIEPMAFIPAAERYNLMPDIDYWVIEKSISLLSEHFQTSDYKNINTRFSINLSGETLGNEALLEYIKSILDASRIPNEALCFEITETAAIQNLEQAATLIKTLRAMGCRFALDDFGSGLCSFGYLKTLPVDYLKIDGTFIRSMADDKVNYTVVQSIIHIASALNMKTIAEYVENKDTIKILKELCVNYAQGYEIGRPIPLATYFEENKSLH